MRDKFWYVTSENYQKQQVITNRIDQLLQNIHQDTAMFSTSIHTLEHDDFKKLVEMGDKIIPYLFYLITQYGCSQIILLLLHQITKVNPIPKEDAGKFMHSIMHWLKWFLESDYYKDERKNDIYFGLVDY